MGKGPQGTSTLSNEAHHDLSIKLGDSASEAVISASYSATQQPKKFLEGTVFFQAPPEYVKVHVL